MNPTDLLKTLADRPLLCDGAMGTQLIARGLAPGVCGEKWNLDRPADIEAVHRAYFDGGCDLITTNSFGATTTALERHGLIPQADAINRAASQIASRVVGQKGWVLGDVGPFGGFLTPVGDTEPEQLQAIFKQQIAALYDGGADAIIIETMSDPQEMAVAIAAAKAVSSRPVIATYAFSLAGSDFRTMMGNTAADAVRQAIDAGADVVGANCGTSLTLPDYVRLAEQLVQAAGSVPAILQPNAGSPSMVNDKLVYPATPADMAELVPTLLGTGLRIIGGCCGTTPDHLRAMAAALRQR